MTIPTNNPTNNQIQPINLLQCQQGENSSFHERASLVIFDILDQLNFSKEKLVNLANIIETLNGMPAFVFLALGENGKGIQKLLADSQPLLALVKTNNDPSYYLNMIPEEKILYFINQVITRLEWVKNGNQESQTILTVSESGHTSE